jgi:hypothetical protein
MLDRLIRYISEHDGVQWMTMEDVAADFRRRHPFKG